MHRLPSRTVKAMVSFTCVTSLSLLLLVLHVADQRPENLRPPRVITLSPSVRALLGKRDEEDMAETTTRFDIPKPLGPPPLQSQCEDNWSLDNLRPKYVPDLEEYLWVDDKHKIIFCGSEGELSRRMLYLLASLNTKKKVSYDRIDYNEGYWLQKYHIKTLSEYTEEGKAARLEGYTKVIGVQHPLDRLYVTFQEDRQNLVYKYTSSYSRTSYTNAADVQFAQFVDYLVHKSLDSKLSFEPLHVTCRPCLVSYDVIVRWENFTEDLINLVRFKESTGEDMGQAESILDSVNLFHPSRLKPSDFLGHYRGLTRKTLDKLHNTYHLDFILFNYLKIFQDTEV